MLSSRGRCWFVNLRRACGLGQEVGKQMRVRNEVGSGMIIENQETHRQVCRWHGAEVQPSTLRVGHKDLKKSCWARKPRINIASIYWAPAMGLAICQIISLIVSFNFPHRPTGQDLQLEVAELGIPPWLLGLVLLPECFPRRKQNIYRGHRVFICLLFILFEWA